MRRFDISVLIYQTGIQAVALVILGCIIYIGPAYLLLSLLLGISVIAIRKPKIIPLAVLYLAPLIRGQSETLGGVLTTPSLLLLWFTAIGGVYYFQILMETGWRIHKSVAYIFALAMVALFSLFFSEYRLETVQEIIRILSIMIMLGLSIYLSREKQFRLDMIKVIVISAIVPLLVGLYQKLSGNLQLGGARLVPTEVLQGITVRLYSTFYDAHPFATYLVIILTVLFVLLLYGKLARTSKLMLSCLFLLALWELNLTYARGELMGFIGSALAILYLSKRMKLRHIALLIVSIYFSLYATENINRFQALLNPISGLEKNSLDFRLSLWKSIFEEIIKNPIIGYGVSSVKDAFGIIAHNDYLSLWYELGLPGVLLYVSFLVYCTYITFIYTRQLEGIDKFIALAGFGLTLTIIIIGLAEPIYGNTTLWWYYTGILSCAIGAYHTSCRSLKEI